MFKENDKVYCPIIGSDIYTLGRCTNIDLYFTEEGKLDPDEFVPSLFHVNEANHEKLESFYGISFTKPTNLSKDIGK